MNLNLAGPVWEVSGHSLHGHNHPLRLRGHRDAVVTTPLLALGPGRNALTIVQEGTAPTPVHHMAGLLVPQKVQYHEHHHLMPMQLVVPTQVRYHEHHHSEHHHSDTQTGITNGTLTKAPVESLVGVVAGRASDSG